MNLSEIKTKSISDLIDIATDLGIEDVGRLKKQDIIFRIFKQQASEGTDIFGGGVLEILNDGFGFLGMKLSIFFNNRSTLVLIALSIG